MRVTYDIVNNNLYFFLDIYLDSRIMLAVIGLLQIKVIQIRINANKLWLS